jgi:hypothetical protein
MSGGKIMCMLLPLIIGYVIGVYFPGPLNSAKSAVGL